MSLIICHITLYFDIFTAFPIIISSDAKVASRVNNNVTVNIEYFSNVPESDVKLYKDVNGVPRSGVSYSVIKIPADVELPVFSHKVNTKGIRASIIVQIKSLEDFGSYYVEVSNEIGSSNKSFEVIMTGNPFQYYHMFSLTVYYV